jgi:hypothetical protein
MMFAEKIELSAEVLQVEIAEMGHVRRGRTHVMIIENFHYSGLTDMTKIRLILPMGI